MPHINPKSVFDNNTVPSLAWVGLRAENEQSIDDDIISILTNKQFIDQAPTNDRGQLILDLPKRSREQTMPGPKGMINSPDTLKSILEYMERPEYGEPHKNPCNWRAFHMNAFYGLLDPRTATRDGRGPCVEFKDYALGDPDRRFEPMKKSIRYAVRYYAAQYDALRNEGKERNKGKQHEVTEDEINESLYDPDGSESLVSIAKRIWKIWEPIEEAIKRKKSDRYLVINAFESRKIEAEQMLGILTDDDSIGSEENNGKGPPPPPPGVAFPLKSNHRMALDVLHENPTSKEKAKSVEGSKVKGSKGKKKRAATSGKKTTPKRKKLRPSSIDIQDEEVSVLQLSDSDYSLDDVGAAKSEKLRLFKKDVKTAKRCSNGPPTELEDDHIDARHNDAYVNSDGLLEDITNEHASYGNEVDKITKAIQESPKTKILNKQGIVAKNINHLLQQKKLMQETGASDEQLALVEKNIEQLLEVSKNLNSDFMKEVTSE